MKTYQLALIFALLSYCLAQDPDECSTKFEAILKEKCELIDSKCVYNSEKQKCGRLCTTGTDSDCSSIIPPDPDVYHCVFDTTCTQKQKNCNYGYNEEICSKMKSDMGNDYRCDILNSGESCQSYLNECPTITLTPPNTNFDTTQRDECINHIPFPYTNKCVVTRVEKNGITQDTCSKVPRNCGDSFYKMDKDICHQLTATNTEKKCFYISDSCQEDYEGCKKYNKNSCNYNVHPLIKNEEGDDDYDFTKTCTWKSNTDGTGECITRNRKCYELRSGEDEEICLQLEATDPNKKECLYDDTRNQDKCYEEYKSCQLYNDNENVKTREECERIIPFDSTKLCYFNEEENKCEERDIFNTCEDYKGNDKNICESIISKTTNSRCILEKDSICKERDFYCSDTNIKYQCLTYAKARDPNKKCVYNNDGECLEEYKSCEDYYVIDGNNDCSSIHPYNGKKCSYELNRCFTKTNLTCSGALTEDECKLVAKSGVSDPDKKVCQWNSGCEENYKYCSDYRGNDDDVCTNIKPYDESGENLDIFSHCKMDNIFGCKRVPYECSEALDRYRCASISPYIKENKIKYCAFFGGTCREFYKNCEDVSLEQCANNIPENYSRSICTITSLNGVDICSKLTTCTNFNPTFYSSLCASIDPKCTYSYENSRATCTTKTDITCSNVQFYFAKDENEEYCRSIEVSDPNKMCSLTSNKLKCRIVDREVNNTSSFDTTSQGNVSKFIGKGINLSIIFILFLLI